MKKLLILVILLSAFSSCSIEDDSEDFYYEVMPIESVDLPENFVLGETHSIGVTYRRTSTCHVFFNFANTIDGNERTIAVVNRVLVEPTCDQDDTEVTINFNFTVSSNEPYVFRFFQGENEEGEDQYYMVEVPVVSGILASGNTSITN